MKFACVLSIATVSSSSGFAPTTGPQASTTILNAATTIWYSSSTGNTETVAGYIATAAGGLDFNDIGDAKDEEIIGSDSLVVGAPTWHTGEETQRSGTSWDDWL